MARNGWERALNIGREGRRSSGMLEDVLYRVRMVKNVCHGTNVTHAVREQKKEL